MTTADRIEKLIGNETREGFAKRAKISVPSLYRYLAGHPLSRSSAEKIARAGGVSIDWLLTGSSESRISEAPAPYGGLDTREREVVEKVVQLLREAEDDIKRNLTNHVELLQRASKTPKRRVSGKD